MNILYIDHYAGSMSMGMEFRPYYMAKEWLAMGHNVRIIGASISHLRKKQPKVKHDFEIQLIDGIEYQWICTGSYKGNGFKRAITMLVFISKLWCHAKKIANDFKPEIVITSSTYPLDSYAGYRIAKISRAKYIHEGHDLWPLTLTEIGGMSKWNPFIMLLEHGQHYAYSHAYKVISILPMACEHMLKHGLTCKENFIYIPNGIVIEDWEKTQNLPYEHTKLLQELKKQGKFIVMYVGGHAISNSLDVLLDAADLTKRDNSIAYVLIGNGTEKERLIALTLERGLNNVKLLPPVDKLSVPTALHNADALYIGAKSTSLYRFGVSMNKIYDYMMAAKPIIYGVDAANNDISEAECGITIKPDSPEAIVDAIKMIQYMSETERKDLGDKGRKWVIENCSYINLAKKFLNFI